MSDSRRALRLALGFALVELTLFAFTTAAAQAPERTCHGLFACEKPSLEELAVVQSKHWQWLESDGRDGEKANLCRADLQEADLRDVNFRLADLSRANLKKARLDGAVLVGTNLAGADLTNAHLSGAEMIGTDLSGTFLGDADLTVSSSNPSQEHYQTSRPSSLRVTSQT